MTIYVSVVSHFHTEELIACLNPAKINATHGIKLVIKDNVHCPDMEAYCEEHEIDYLVNEAPKGFGHNHNDVFLYCSVKYAMKPEDHFVVLNPDVIVEPSVFAKLASAMEAHNVRLAAPNLYQDASMKILEGSIRKYPYPWDFFTSYVFGSRKTTVLRHNIHEPTSVDWASGAFLVFKASLYKQLSGFDPRYYLYCEDVDICWRAKVLFNEPTLYLPEIKAVHKGHRDSRNAISSYLKWHVESALKWSVRFMNWKFLGLKPKTY